MKLRNKDEWKLTVVMQKNALGLQLALLHR